MSGREREPERLSQPGNRLTAFLGNLAMWAVILLAVVFGGWAVTTVFGALVG